MSVNKNVMPKFALFLVQLSYQKSRTTLSPSDFLLQIYLFSSFISEFISEQVISSLCRETIKYLYI